MAVFHLDADAIVKRYRSEAGSDVIDELINQSTGADQFYTSFLPVLEVTSAIRRLEAGRRLNTQVADNVLAKFASDIRDWLRLWRLNNEVVASTLRIVNSHKLRSGDAIHLATVLLLRPLSVPNTIVMVTSDSELLRAADAEGLAVLNPTLANALEQLRQLRGPT